MFFGGSPFDQFAGMHGGEGGPPGGGGGRRPPAGDVDTNEFYEILDIAKDASESEIKKAYRKKALKVREGETGREKREKERTTTSSSKVFLKQLLQLGPNMRLEALAPTARVV